MSLPGTWLLARAGSVLDPDVVRSLLAPAIADLQYETLNARDARARRVALARGYAAVTWLVLFHGLDGRSPMRRLVAVLALGGLGSVLLIAGARVASVGPGGLAGFFLMAVLAPAALRRLDGRAGFGRMFANCCAIGLMMAATFFAWVALIDATPTAPWHVYAAASACLAGCVVLGSALAAAVASKRPSAGESLRHRELRHVGVTAALFFACYSLLALSSGFGSRPLFATLSWAAFLAFFFAAVSVAIYLPVLLGLRHALGHNRGGVLLACVGAALFPVPLFAFPLLQGRLISTWHYLVGHPGGLLPVALPYVLAGAVLGWLLADRALAGEGRLA